MNIKTAGPLFHRFNVLWTPTVLILDESGTERFRSEGYLPRNEFAAQLALGLARNAFEHKRWDEAERWYDHVLDRYAQTASAAEALYWKSVSRYKATNDHTWLAKINAGFRDHYRDSLWAEKASIFLDKAA